MSSRSTAPVIIVSPAVRAGTTLVQRLLCSARNALIYGDMVGQEAEFFAKYAVIKRQMLEFHAPGMAAVRSAVLAGQTDDFITPLAPSVGALAEAYRLAGMAWLQHCAQEAGEMNRPVWGWKMAGADALALPVWLEWFPESKFIWVERAVADCFASAKAANMVSGERDAQQFAQHAAAARTAFARLEKTSLTLEYDEFLRNPEQVLARLEAFTGAQGIDARVFTKRVNMAGNPVAVLPAPVTEAELAALESAGSLPSVLHPSFAA